MTKLKYFGKGILTFLLYYIGSLCLGSIASLLFKNSPYLIKNIGYLLSEVIMVLILFMIYRKRLKEEWLTFKKDQKTIMTTAFKWWILGLIIMFISNIIINTISGSMAANESANRELMLNYPIYSIGAMALCAPFIEEIVFRFSFRKAFNKELTFAIFSFFLFGGIHILASIDFTALSSFNWFQLLYIIPYGALGFIFAKIYYKTNTIYSTIFIHMIHNTISIAMVYLAFLI